MATISSSEYKCDNGQLLNTKRWWTEPISLPDNPNGVVLCGGNVPNSTGPGIGDDSCISVDLYTCVSSRVPSTMGTTRQSLQPICLTAGQCYLFGGNTSTASEATRSVDYFDLRKLTLQKTRWQLPEPRLCYAATSLNDSYFIVTGGYGVKDPATGKGPVYNTAVRFNSVTGQSTTIAMARQRGGHSITKLPDETYLLLGGSGDDSNGGEIFDPQTNRFTAIQGKMGSGRKDHRAVLANDGNVYIIGGTAGQSAPTSIEVYNPITQQFSDSGLKISEGREDVAVVYIKELNVIIAVGGEIKGKPGEPESKAIDAIDLNAKKVYSENLKTPRDEPSLMVKEINVKKKQIRLVALTGQRKINGTEISLPAEEIVVSL